MRCNLAPGCISSDVKLCQRKPLFFFFRDPFFWDPLFSFFLFFLGPAKVGSLEMQPGAKLQAYLGVIILQPHACTQRFRLRILRRTRSNAGRTVLEASQVEYKPFGKPPLRERRTVGRRAPTCTKCLYSTYGTARTEQENVAHSIKLGLPCKNQIAPAGCGGLGPGTYSTHSMELEESGAKPGYLHGFARQNAVLQADIVFCTGCPCQPRWFVGSTLTLARPTGPVEPVLKQVWRTSIKPGGCSA